MAAKEQTSGTTVVPPQSWAETAKPKSEKMPDKTSFQVGKTPLAVEVPVKDGEPTHQDTQIAQ